MADNSKQAVRSNVECTVNRTRSIADRDGDGHYPK
jgi:hypothetical protein